MNTYAIEHRGIVRAVIRDKRTAGDPQFCRAMNSRLLPGETWVYMESECRIGDVLEIGDGGCARVKE